MKRYKRIILLLKLIDLIPSKKLKCIISKTSFLELILNKNNTDGDPVLFEVIKTGKLSFVKLCIKYGSNVNGKNIKDETPLCYAIYENNLELVKFLISKGSNVNYTTYYEKLPYECPQNTICVLDNLGVHSYFGEEYNMLFIARYNVEIVKVLIKNNVDINIIFKNKIASPIFWSEIIREDRIAEVTEEEEIDVNEDNVLNRAIKDGCIDTTLLLIDAGAKIKNLEYAIGLCLNYNHNTENNIEYMKLKDKIKNPNTILQNKLTLINYFIMHNQTEFVSFLISISDDINFPDLFYKRTPLHYAVEKNNMELVDLLLKKGANINYKDEFGDTALNIASRENNIEMVEFLVNNVSILG